MRKTGQEIVTSLTAGEIAQRVAQVESGERFSALTARIRNRAHFDRLMGAEALVVTAPDGVYTAEIADWDDAYLYIDLT